MLTGAFQKRSNALKRSSYAWCVCLGCALLIFCTSGLAINAFTIYQPYIMQQGGLSNTQSSSLIMVRSLSAFFAMLLTGPYYRRLPLRAGMTLSGLMVAAGLLVYGLARGFAACCLAAAVTGMGYGLGTMIPVSMLLERWFVAKRKLALGFCTAITGFSTFGIPSLLTHLIETAGLRATFFGESLAIAALTAVSCLLIRNAPAEMGLEPLGAGTKAEAAARSRRQDGLGKRDWLLLVPMLLLVGAMTNVAYSHLTVYIRSQGFPPQAAAVSMTITGVALIAGKLVYGGVSEKLGCRKGDRIFFLFLMLGLLLCCLDLSSSGMLYTAMLSYGIGLPATTTGLMAWAGDWSSDRQYDAAVRRFQLGYSGGTLLFSPLPGVIADLTGSYRAAYVFFLLCAFFVIGVSRYMYRKTELRPRKG